MKKKYLKLLFTPILIGLIYIAYLQINFYFCSIEKTPENADYLIILGTKINGTKPSVTLKDRIDTAASYLKNNKHTIAIASGGKGPNEEVTEASVIKKVLIKDGIEKKRILVEDHSSRTQENISNSKRLFTIKNPTVIVVSNYFHLYRAKLISEDQGLKVNLLGAETPHNKLFYWYSREYLAMTKYYFEKFGIMK